MEVTRLGILRLVLKELKGRLRGQLPCEYGIMSFHSFDCLCTTTSRSQQKWTTHIDRCEVPLFCAIT